MAVRNIRPLKVHSLDWEDGGWKVVLTDDYHTWKGSGILLSWAFFIAFGNYVFDWDKWKK